MNKREKFGLSAEATESDVKRRWHQLALEHHPDRGGNPETLNEFRTAYKAALAEAQAPVKCTECKGTGRKHQTHGFGNITMQCRRCRGTGKINQKTEGNKHE